VTPKTLDHSSELTLLQNVDLTFSLRFSVIHNSGPVFSTCLSDNLRRVSFLAVCK